MATPFRPGLLSLAFLALLCTSGQLFSSWNLDFTREALGPWPVKEQGATFGKSGGDTLSVEIVPGEDAQEGHRLRIAGDLRGFRVVRDLPPLPQHCRLECDFLLTAGSFQFRLFESARTRETLTNDLWISVKKGGELVSRTVPDTVHTHGKLPIGERVRLTVELDFRGNGKPPTYRLSATSLATGEAIPLAQPEAEVQGTLPPLAGLDIGVLSKASELFVERITLSELP